MSPSFSGEVQFAGYADSSRSGPRVTFRLSERADLDKFAGCEGKRYMLALVEIGDDEQPVGQAVPVATQAVQRRAPSGPLCTWVAIRCREPEFAEFLAPIYDRHMGGSGIGWGDVTPVEDFGGSVEKWAAHAVKVLCDVASRSEIDGNKSAETRLHTLIRQPYSAWLDARLTA